MRLIALFAVLTLAAAQTFEVASIHPNVTGTEGSVINLPETGRLTVTNATLKTLIRAAWGIQNDQISGGPKWLDTDRYDIEARTSGPITEDQDHPLLQSLLADRFRLKTHREQRELTVYGLMLAKNGPLFSKIFAKSTGTSSSIHTNHGPGESRIAVTGISIGQFAGMLGNRMGRIVIDKTGLTGNYDFALVWDPDSTPGSTVPSVFAALQEQMGLRLESQKAMVPVLVIDGADHPSDN
jgi:uncharacterized protein (TIGR03435 family)